MSAKVEAPPPQFISSFDAEQGCSVAWALVRLKMVQGEGPKEAIIWGIRNGANLPDDFETRRWIADALEGKLDPKRSRGAPKKRKRRDWDRAIVEKSIAKTYANWLTAFQHNCELAWLRFEELRLRHERPDDAAWHIQYDLGIEEELRSYETALADLGSRPCPLAGRGSMTPRELAFKATAEECEARWKEIAGKPLTPAVVARIITRAQKTPNK